jgi:hypothetical protein
MNTLLVPVQVSLLTTLDLPTIPSSTTVLPFPHLAFTRYLSQYGPPRLSPGQTAQVGGSAVARSEVRHRLEGSPTGLAESGSSSYGLVFRLQLLPTPSREDAVTFD